MTNHCIPFLTIHAESALPLVDLIQRIVENGLDLSGLMPEKQKGVQTHVEPNLPPDVLGIFVFLPKV